MGPYITVALALEAAEPEPEVDPRTGEPRRNSVLVHAATGGVGLAAHQLLAASGREMIATAGNPKKRAMLRDMGVKVVAGSRDTEFTEVRRCRLTSG